MKKIFTLSIIALAACFSANAQNSIEIGADTEKTFDGGNFYNAPILATYKYTLSQSVYPANMLEEIKNSKITGLKFRFFPNSYEADDYSTDIKMFVSETENADFIYENNKYLWKDFDESAPNYEGSFSFNPCDATCEYEDVDLDITLSSPYTYTGSNLVVTTMAIADHDIDDGCINFYDCGSDTKTSTLVYCSDKNAVDIENIPDPTVRHKNAVPSITITYEKLTTGITQTAIINSGIHIDGKTISANNGKVTIYDTLGKLVAQGNGSATVATKGLYIVKNLNNTYKIIIK